MLEIAAVTFFCVVKRRGLARPERRSIDWSWAEAAGYAGRWLNNRGSAQVILKNAVTRPYDIPRGRLVEGYLGCENRGVPRGDIGPGYREGLSDHADPAKRRSSSRF